MAPPAIVLQPENFTSLNVSSVDDLNSRTLLLSDLTGKIVWRMTRKIENGEIIESVACSSDSGLWTIHKPINNGWYIRLKESASLNPFIELLPIKNHDHKDSTAILSFSLPRSSMPELIPPSPNVRLNFLDEKGEITVSKSQISPHSEPNQQFILQPFRPNEERALGWTESIRNWMATENGNFSCISNTSKGLEMFRFIDHSRLLSTGTQGLLTFNLNSIRSVGVSQPALLAVSLGYLAFLEDKSAYLAASS